jgi:sulfoacetaldehyde acetyltransferase
MSTAIRGAFRAALALRGPAQVDIPRDSYYGVWEEDALDPEHYRTNGTLGGADDESIEHACHAIQSAKKIAILAGLGAVESDAGEDIDQLAEMLSCPVATVWQHNDAIINTRPLSVGSVGYQGSEAAMRLVADSDVIIALGTRLNAFGTTPQYGIDFFPKTAKLIHNSMNPLEIGALRPVHVGLVGDCRAVTRQLIAALRGKPLAVDATSRRQQIAQERSQWASKLEKMSRIDGAMIQPRRAMWEVSRAILGDVAIVADVGNISGSAGAYFDRFSSHRRWFGAGSLGGIGVGYPTALGVKLGRPELPVIALIGDGAWSMSLQEVMTAVREKLNVCAVVFSNSVYGAERRNQFDFFGKRYFFTDLENPSFAKIASDMGARGIAVDKAEDIGDAVKAGLAADRPSVIEIQVDPGVLNEPYRRDALKMPTRVMEKYQAISAKSA